MFESWPGARGPLFRPPEMASDIRCAERGDLSRGQTTVSIAPAFATTQAAYEGAYRDLFAMLDRLERRLGEQSFLLGDQVTEADWRLFTTLLRFDAAYYGHFKCNRDR
jgi:putative glutathione S-transferase